MKREGKPHIHYSRYWLAWACSMHGLTRIGETPVMAYGAFRRAQLAGQKR